MGWLRFIVWTQCELQVPAWCGKKKRGPGKGFIPGRPVLKGNLYNSFQQSHLCPLSPTLTPKHESRQPRPESLDRQAREMNVSSGPGRLGTLWNNQA